MVQRRDQSQCLSSAPDGSDPRWLGEIGHCSGLTYSYTYPGGPSTLSVVLQVPPTYRSAALTPGRRITVWRGASQIWAGRLDEPQAAVDGWTLTATGIGSLGSSFCDIWTTWDSPDDHINQAIARGLPWKNPGISTAGLWLGDETDSGSQQISDFLSSITVQGAMGWSVDCRDGTLRIAPLPATVDRLLVSTSPVSRTVADDINRLFMKYQLTNDDSTTTAVATYGIGEAQNAADIALHGPTESYFDTTSNGIMSESAAVQNGQNILSRYNRASFASPFTVGYGQVLTTGGYPVDLGADQAGLVYRLILLDFGYGGEVTAAPVTIIGGGYQYDDSTQTAQISPFQSVDDSLSGILAAVFPTTSTPS